MAEVPTSAQGLIEDHYKVQFEITGGDRTSLWQLPFTNSGPPQIERALLPESFDQETGSDWESPLNFGFEALNTALQFTGQGAMKTDALALLKWKGTNPIDLSLNFKFVTWEDPLTDVFNPAMTLSMLGTSTELQDSDWKVNPPVISAKTQGKSNQIPRLDITIGEPARRVMEKVTPTNINVSWPRGLCRSPSDGKAYPAFAEVSFDVRVVQFPVASPGKLNMGFS